MRFLITAGAGDEPKPQSDQDFDKMLAAYMKYNEEMHKAGVLIASEGLHPGGFRARVTVSRGKRTAVDGPFTETKELLGGLYLIEVPTREEAVAWALRCPVGLGTDDVLEIYQMTELSDLPQKVQDAIVAAAPTWAAAVTTKKR
jgi:hypothetical protein